MANILIVDDEIVFGSTDNLRRALEANGHTVKEAGNDREAFALCAKQNFDLVVMDLGLPMDSLDGIQLTQELKKRGSSAKFILNSSSLYAAQHPEEVNKWFDGSINK